jgi:hypothetical protein
MYSFMYDFWEAPLPMISEERGNEFLKVVQSVLSTTF